MFGGPGAAWALTPVQISLSSQPFRPWQLGGHPFSLPGRGWGVLPFRLPGADFALGTRGTGGQDCSSPAPDGQREDESGRLSPAFLSFVAKDRDVPG